MVRNGRRDIGADEYDFFTPSLYPRSDSYSTVRRGTTVRLTSGAFDQDYEPMQVRWMLSDGSESAYEMTNTIEEPALHRRYPRVGTYEERVSAVDPTGLSASAKLVIRVVRQRMELLALSRQRFRAARRQGGSSRAEIYLRTAAPDAVHFRVERGVRGSRGLRWARTRLRFRLFSTPDAFPYPFDGWVGGHRLRPGRYRLVAAPLGVRPLRVRFQIIR